MALDPGARLGPYEKRQQISTGGGQRPLWSPDGRNLYFISDDFRQLLIVPIQAGAKLTAGRPQVVLEPTGIPGAGNGGARLYDIAPDGRYFVIRTEQSPVATSSASSLVLVQNWQEELKRVVPRN